ncbi:hypothetical protein JOS77_26840 [Chromobacterium haemolyticum]|nr:hypothetical protein JOS77_26840 [Chromobacterium haemolyticum]
MARPRAAGLFADLEKNGEEITAAQIGFDRAVAKELPLYLRLLHSAIESALAAGGRRVIFGRTALEPKARMGCRPVPTSLWIRHRQPMLNSLIRSSFGIVQHEDAPTINPFKKINAQPFAPRGGEGDCDLGRGKDPI